MATVCWGVLAGVVVITAVCVVAASMLSSRMSAAERGATFAEYAIRAGICPDCGNNKCMADGVTGLWCPNCDASYLL